MVAANPSSVDRTPPHSAEAEEHVIACCLIDGGATMKRALAAKIFPDTFYMPANREIWSCMSELLLSSNTISFEQLADRLREKRQLAVVGGMGHLMELSSRVPTTAHAGYFIDKVREKYLLRESIRHATSIVEQAYGFTGGIEDFTRDAADRFRRIDSSSGDSAFKPEDVTEMIAKPAEKPAELIKGVLHAACKIIITAPSKARKTYTLIDLALAVATGTPFIGWETAQGKVAYLNFELHKRFFGDRCEHVAKARGLTLKKGTIDIFNLRGMARDIQQMMPELTRSLRGKGYKLIIFDPIYMMLGKRDENSAGDMNEMMNEFEGLAIDTGAAIAFAHHYTKGNAAGKSAQDRMSGSGVFARNPDAIVTMTEHAEADCYTVETILRYCPPIKKFVVRWKYPLYEIDASLDADNLKQLAGRGKATSGKPSDAQEKSESYDRDDMLRYYPPATGKALPIGQAFRHAAEGCGVSRSTFMRLRKQLLEAEMIRQMADDRWMRTAFGDEQREHGIARHQPASESETIEDI